MDFDYKLLAKYLTENLNSEELSKIMRWRQDSEQNKLLFKSLMELRIKTKYTEFDSSERVESALSLLDQKINKNKRSGNILNLVRVAAVIIVLISLSYGGWTLLTPQNQSYISIKVEEGENVKKMDLADGTTVWLNGSSELQIPETFSSDKRIVKLSGEAFFDVRKKSKSPFIVNTDQQLSIKVMGTSFGLNANKKDQTVEAILVSGKISLINEDQKEIYHMTPGEKVTYSSQLNQYLIKTVDTNVSTAWHLNQLKFENATLRDIANKLTLIYDVNINLESKSLADKKIRCVINKDETLLEVLEILQYLAPIKYRIEENEVFISE